MRVVSLLAVLALLAGCTSTPSAEQESPSPSPLGTTITETDAHAPEVSAVPAVAIDPAKVGEAEKENAQGLAAPESAVEPALPGTPVGRATSTNDDSVAPGMVRVIGEVRTESQGVGGICIVLGPRPRCAVLTADDGRWVIDVPQGPIKWEIRFLRGQAELAIPMYVQGPFPSDRVATPPLVLPTN